MGTTAFDPAVVEPGGTDSGGGNEGHSDESVGDAAMVLENLRRGRANPQTTSRSAASAASTAARVA